MHPGKEDTRSSRTQTVLEMFETRIFISSLYYHVPGIHFFKEFFSFPYSVLRKTFSLPTKGPLDSRWLGVRLSAPGTGSRPLWLPPGWDSRKICCSSVRYAGRYRSGPAHAKSSGGSGRPRIADVARGRDGRQPACTELRRWG